MLQISTLNEDKIIANSLRAKKVVSSRIKLLFDQRSKTQQQRNSSPLVSNTVDCCTFFYQGTGHSSVLLMQHERLFFLYWSTSTPTIFVWIGGTVDHLSLPESLVTLSHSWIRYAHTCPRFPRHTLRGRRAGASNSGEFRPCCTFSFLGGSELLQSSTDFLRANLNYSRDRVIFRNWFFSWDIVP